jgi:hypothetical protein
MTSPAHRAAIGFLRGALIAVVAEALATPLAASLGSLSAMAPVSSVVRTLVPLAGFAFGGAVGGEALDAGRVGSLAFAVGGLATGVVLTFTSPHLSGLTGHEHAGVVLAYAAGTSSAAFGLGGWIGSAMLRRGVSLPATAAFAAAGALGGVVGVLPFFLTRVGGREWLGLGMQFTWLTASIASIAVPLALGGALSARALHARRDR